MFNRLDYDLRPADPDTQQAFRFGAFRDVCRACDAWLEKRGLAYKGGFHFGKASPLTIAARARGSK